MKLSVWIADEHYRSLFDLAKAKGYRDVGELLGRAAPLLLEKPSTGRRTYVRMTPALRARMLELHREGRSASAIAAELGVSRSSVWNHLNAAPEINAEANR